MTAICHGPLLPVETHSIRGRLYDLWSEDGVFFTIDTVTGERFDFPGPDLQKRLADEAAKMEKD